MTASTEHKSREVVPLQAEYISTSRKNAVQRQRNLTIGIGLVLVVSILLGIFALFQWRSAVESKKEAERSAAAAAASEQVALAQKAIAEEKEALALAKEIEAKAQRSTAQAGVYRGRPGELDTSTLLALDALDRLSAISASATSAEATFNEAEDTLRHNLAMMPTPSHN